MRREWLPTLVFLPGESHGQRSLVGYSPGGRRESDTTSKRRKLHEGRTAPAHPEMPLIHKHCSHTTGRYAGLQAERTDPEAGLREGT